MITPTYDSLVEVAGHVSRETYETMIDFESRFRTWNSRINLISAGDLEGLWRRHILDSAQLLRHAGPDRRWLDLGSGGGFPSLVVAILLREQTPSYVSMVESNRKKCAFLQAMIGEFALRAHVHAERIEMAKSLQIEADIVTARALAPLPILLELASSWLTSGARGLFHKGRDWQKEIVGADSRWRFDLIEHASIVETHSVILEIRNLRSCS